jgi:hypothetical protein
MHHHYNLGQPLDIGAEGFWLPCGGQGKDAVAGNRVTEREPLTRILADS